MKIRFKNNLKTEGQASQFNIMGIGEVITSGEWGADSTYIKDLEVFLEATQQWKDMNLAFLDKDIVPDNYNIWFAEPKTELDKERGFFL